MNIRSRAQLYAGVYKVLRPGGRFAMYDVIAVDKRALVFPVPWARTPQISFLLTEQEMRESLRDAGFAEVAWIDQTASGIRFFDEQQYLRTMGESQSSLGLHLVMGPEFPTMAANLGRNQKEGRVASSRQSESDHGRLCASRQPAEARGPKQAGEDGDEKDRLIITGPNWTMKKDGGFEKFFILLASPTEFEPVLPP